MSRLRLSDIDRRRGIHIVAPSGFGKSWSIGRRFAFNDLCRNVPVIIFDPIGSTIDNLLDKIGKQPKPFQKKLWKRIRYVDMSGRGGCVMPFPIYYTERQGDSLYRSASRFIETIKRLDPKLDDAPVQGMNAIRPVGLNAGVILSALGYQITEADELLTDPSKWEDKFQYLLSNNPTNEIKRAVYFWKHQYSKSQALLFRGKLTDLVFDPVNRCIFGASQPAIDWEEVINKRLCVLIDTSQDGDTDDYMCSVKMQWVFRSLMSYIKRAGRGRKIPISIYIDELASMYNTTDNLLSRDMDQLINGVARNYNIWLTLAHQEMYQFEEKTQKALMSMGTQIIGNTDDQDAAMRFARRYDEIDPHKVKRTTKKWVSSTSKNMGYTHDGHLIPLDSSTEHYVIDEDPVEYSLNEQLHMSSYKYMNQRPFHFLVRTPEMKRFQSVSMRDLDPGQTINLADVELAKNTLMRVFGRKIDDVEAEIEGRLSGKIKEYEAPRDDIPENTTFNKEAEVTRALGKPDTDTEIGETHDLWEEI